MNIRRISSRCRTGRRGAIVRAAIILVMLLLVNHVAVAWGPATHVYIVTRILGDQESDAVFGATLPDFNGAARLRPEVDRAIKHLTHHEFERLAPSLFAAGFATHNGAWGGDHYAHHYLKDEQSTYYATRKIKELSALTGLSLNLSEDVFEAAMDIQVALDCGPRLGRLLKGSAHAAGVDAEQAVVAAFAGPLAERAPELTPVEAESILRWAYRAHKTLMQAFGIQLAQDRAYMLRIGAPLLARHVKCDASTARGYLETALTLCTDWRPELDKIAEDVRAGLLQTQFGEVLNERREAP